MNEFQYILNNYNDGTTKVDKTNKCYIYLKKTIPEILQNFLKRNDYKIYGSYGEGTKTFYPWVAVLNKKITQSTKTGLYMVFLFRKDMKGFYLSLNQGITKFKDAYKLKKIWILQSCR